MKEHGIGRALGLFVIMTVLCGVIYMLAVTGLAQMLFPEQANGSIIEIDGKKYCPLLGQSFEEPGHLWGRVMNVDTGTYTDDEGHVLMYAGPSNLSPASEEYAALIAERVEKIRAAHPEQDLKKVPVDLVTCSGSGLDPDISPAAAEYQVARIAANTAYTEEEVRAIIAQYTTGRFLGVLGEPRVNVLKVNLALEGIL